MYIHLYLLLFAHKVAMLWQTVNLQGKKKLLAEAAFGFTVVILNMSMLPSQEILK